MIQDRLTAKFQTNKPAERPAAPAAAPMKKAKAPKPATDAFAKGRTLPGSFWL